MIAAAGAASAQVTTATCYGIVSDPSGAAIPNATNEGTGAVTTKTTDSAGVGHHVASEAAAYGRAHGKPPKDISFDEVAQTYQKATGQKIPLTAAEGREAINAQDMIANREGPAGHNQRKSSGCSRNTGDGLPHRRIG